MKTLTVRLPEALVAEIEAESRGAQPLEIRRRTGTPERLPSAARSAALDAIADLVGSVGGLPADLSGGRKRVSRRPAMAGSALVDAGLFVALLSRRDAHHGRQAIPAVLP